MGRSSSSSRCEVEDDSLPSYQSDAEKSGIKSLTKGGATSKKPSSSRISSETDDDLNELVSERPEIVRDRPTPTPEQRPKEELLKEIQRGKLLKQTLDVNDKSDPVDVGRVLHQHIAPRVFSKEVRKLMREISREEKKKKLKKVQTSDRSAPYIPKDMEIYFYGGGDKSKDKALPPVSRTLPNCTDGGAGQDGDPPPRPPLPGELYFKEKEKRHRHQKSKHHSKHHRKDR